MTTPADGLSVGITATTRPRERPKSASGSPTLINTDSVPRVPGGSGRTPNSPPLSLFPLFRPVCDRPGPDLPQTLRTRPRVLPRTALQLHRQDHVVRARPMMAPRWPTSSPWMVGRLMLLRSRRHGPGAGLPDDELGLTTWGIRAVVSPGQGAAAHLRTAIQILSTDATRSVPVYRHTGWRLLGERWVFPPRERSHHCGRTRHRHCRGLDGWLAGFVLPARRRASNCKSPSAPHSPCSS